VASVPPPCFIEKTVGYNDNPSNDGCRAADSSIVVFGCGCTGMIIRARYIGASRIIAIDTNPTQGVWPFKFTTKGFINSTALPPGVGGIHEVALEVCHKSWDMSTIIGVAPAGAQISTQRFRLVTGRMWHVSACGGMKGWTERSDLVEDYKKCTCSNYQCEGSPSHRLAQRNEG